MRQQVNLYRDGFEVPKIEFSANTMAAIVGVIVLLFVAGSVVSEMRTESLKSKVRRMDLKNQSLTQDLESLNAQLDALKASPALERRAERLQRSVRAKQKLIALLGESTGGNTEGFASYLRGLAKHPVQGIWLTQIAFQNGGQDISFSGIATRPENLPGFLQRIGQEKPFAGRSFEKLEMTTAEDQEASEEGESKESVEKLEFQMQTRLEESAR